MSAVVFRPRIAPWVIGAILMTLVSYVAFVLLLPKTSLPDYPFGLAAVIGGANLTWNLLVHGRKHGIRADATGITDVHTNITIRYDAITAIRLDIERVRLQNGEALVRVATIDAGERIRFGDLGPGRPPRAATIVNIEPAGLLLAIVASRTAATALFPQRWTEPTASAEPAPVTPPRRFQLANLGGLVALVFKVGPKLAAIAVKLLKSIKLGSVAVTIAAYSLIWSWQFALALVGMILVHECGHAFAMWRSGVPVKGIYFIPFFGGAAVSQGVARTRAKAAYIAINGPIWGMALALVCFAAFAIGDGAHPLLGTLAAWGALLNLFNLLPIFPLDGGRIVASLSHASPKGIPVVAATLVLGAAVAYFAQLELLFLVGMLGVFELVGRRAAAIYGPALALLGDRPLDADAHEHFARCVAFVEPGRDSPSRVAQRQQEFTHRKAEGEQTPMTFRQGCIVLAGYVLVVGVLVAILFLTSSIAGSGQPLDLLR